MTDDMTKRIENLEYYLSILVSRIKDLKAEDFPTTITDILNQHQSNYDTLSKSHSALSQLVKSKVDGFEKSIDESKKSIDDLYQKYFSLHHALGILNKKSDDHSTVITKTSDDVSKMATKLDTQSRIANQAYGETLKLTDSVNGLDSKGTEFLATYAVHKNKFENDILALKDQGKDTGSKFSSHKKDLQTLRSDLESLSQTVKQGRDSQNTVIQSLSIALDSYKSSQKAQQSITPVATLNVDDLRQKIDTVVDDMRKYSDRMTLCESQLVSIGRKLEIIMKRL